jgi:hypothetical protein
MAKSINLKLLESDPKVIKLINKALIDEINKRGRASAGKIQRQLAPVFTSALASSPEMDSVRGGILALEFGLESDPSSTIVSAIVDSLRVRWVPVREPRFVGGLEVTMQPNDFANLLGLSVANQPIEGGSLPWLSWLLTLGDQIIITGYGVEFGSFPNTRTGQARMSEGFAPYKVNSAFSGTIEDNFITRAIARSSSQITKIIKGAL